MRSCRSAGGGRVIEGELYRIGSSIIPVFLIIGLGVFLARRLPIHVQTLTLLTWYLFSPCLIFDATVRHASRVSFLPMACAVVPLTVVCLVLGRGVAALARADRAKRASVSGASAFVNAGNMGLPIALFAYGQEGLARAAAFMVAMALCINTLGIVVYAMGREARPANAVVQAFKVPLVYAAALAMLLPAAGIELPPLVGRPVSMMGQAAIPVLMLAFGIQLGGMKLKRPSSATWGVVVVRLVTAPLLAWVVAGWLVRLGWFGPLDEKTFILMCGLPPAVYNYLLAERLGGDVKLVSETILWATVISFVTLSVILALLG